MGGCRCTYRNCKSKSDGGKTHLFHYPVFDKLRCQQWIINARRFEFLNLTVSQLKNRVVCQHHFQDDAFMNSMNNRLKYDAIPTENGPYCSFDKESIEHAEAVSDLPLTADDVENIETMCTTEKKEIFPVKYVDFLTDGVQTDINDYTTKKKDYITIDIDFRKSFLKKQTVLNSKSFQESADIKNKIKNKQTDLKSFQECADISESNDSIKQENLVDTTTTINDNAKPIINDKSISTNNNKKAPNNNKRVKILSQKIISGAIKLDSSGSIVKSFSQSENKQKNNAEIFDVNVSKVQPDNINSNKKKEEFNNEINSSINVANPTLKQHVTEKNMLSNPLQKVNQLTPEKIAAIQEKRNFNMKLRDIITSGLNKMNDIDNTGSNIEEEKNSTNKIETRKNIDNNAFIDLKKQMRIMETNLIKKVEQNSNQILAMKNLLNVANDTNDNSMMRKKKSTQTSYSQEEHKQYLFKELSGLISENLKNQLYEELFIKDDKCNSAKRPKRRK